MSSIRRNKSNGGTSKTAAVFLGAGVLVLAVSILLNWQVLAFIGLGFVFWGAIFSLAKPGKFVDGGLLDGTANSVYSTLDRMIKDLRYNGRGYYIPSYPKDANLPDYFKNLRDSIVFISDENFTGLPAIEELASGKFLSERDPGVFIVSPGSGVLNQIENRLKIDFSSVPLSELTSLLPQCMTEFFNLARDMDLQVIDDSTVHLRAEGILYESLYKSENIMKSVDLLGCPVVSAVACALAKSTGKTVVIREQKFLPEVSGVEALFGFVKA